MHSQHLLFTRFHTGEFVYLLELIYGLKSILSVFLRSFADVDVCRATKTLSCPVTLRLPSRAAQGQLALPFCFSSHTMSRCPFHGIFSVTFLHFCVFIGNFTVENGPKYNFEVLSSIPQHKKAVMCLMEKIHVFNTHELNVIN